VITLFPHQIEDAKFLASKSFAGNFSGMGSGKTYTALEAVKILNVVENHYLSTIIVGPPISLHMWAEEFENYFEESTTQILKTGKSKINPDADALIMSYQIATKRKEELKALGAKVLIFDESHALKSISAKRTKALIGRGGLCESVDHTYCLSGTPSTRWNDDLFSFMCRADNAKLKEAIGGITMDKFRLRFCISQKKRFTAAQRWPVEITVGNRNTEELNKLLFNGSGGMAVRRELADVWAAMPPITINRLTVQLDADAELSARLKQLDKMTQRQIETGIANNEEHISTTRRMIGAAKVKHSVAEIVDRIEAGIKPILVGAWHTEVIDELHFSLAEKKIVSAIIDGRTSAAAREMHVKAFNKGTIEVLIGQIAAMGVSLNLQGGSHIICVEEDWSPAIMDQFFARCHRIGQANHVHVDIFTSDNKLDKAVRRISGAKRRGHNTLMEQDDD
jgi:SNF2 family DNA or RNA helicase